MPTVPFISIIIPCRNEGKFINVCLDTVLKNNYPQDSLEILVVDGLSTDDGPRCCFQEAPWDHLCNCKGRQRIFSQFRIHKKAGDKKGCIGYYYIGGEIIVFFH